jgi:DNA-binding LacI/PurR family transcriptional regulator
MPVREMAARAVWMAIGDAALVRSGKAEIMQPTLVVRASTGPAVSV